jgi:hypothetical protein
LSSIAALLRAGVEPGRLAGLFVGVGIVEVPFAAAALEAAAEFAFVFEFVFATICIPFSVLLGAMRHAFPGFLLLRRGEPIGVNVRWRFGAGVARCSWCGPFAFGTRTESALLFGVCSCSTTSASSRGQTLLFSEQIFGLS